MSWLKKCGMFLAVGSSWGSIRSKAACAFLIKGIVVAMELMVGLESAVQSVTIDVHSFHLELLRQTSKVG